MKTLTVQQMEAIEGGKKESSEKEKNVRKAVGCTLGAIAGLAGIVLLGLGTAGVGVVAASLALSLSAPVTACLI